MKTKFAIFITALLFSIIAKSQCNPGFTITYGSNGNVVFEDTTANVTTSAYQGWNFGYQNYSNNGDTVSFTYPYNGTYTVTLSIADSLSGCFGNATALVTITNSGTQPPCSASFTYTADTAGIVHFSNTSVVDTNSVSTYNWNFGNGAVMTAASPSYTYYYNGTFTVTMQISNPVANCFASASQTLAVTNAVGAPSCTAAFTYLTGANGLVSFTSNYTGNQATMQSWSFGDGYSASTNFDTIQHTYQYNGSYIVNHNLMDSVAGCFANFTDTIMISNTTPCGPPTTTVYLYPDSFQTSVWYATANYDPQVVSAVWFWGDGTSDAGFAPTHTYAGPGWYTICVMTMNSCNDTLTTCITDSLYHTAQMISVEVQNPMSTGTNEILLAQSADLYPNPSTGLLNISLHGWKSQNTIVNFQLVSASGQLVDSKFVAIDGSQNFIQLDYSKYESGLYVLKISDGTHVLLPRVMITK